MTYEAVTMILVRQPRLGAATKAGKVVATLFIGQPRLGVVSKRDKVVRTLYVSQERLVFVVVTKGNQVVTTLSWSAKTDCCDVRR